MQVKKQKIQKQSNEIISLKQQIASLNDNIVDLKEVNAIYEKKFYKTKKEVD